jgi:hypothetical protein
VHRRRLLGAVGHGVLLLLVGHEHHNAPRALAARPPEALHHAHRRRERVKAHHEVHRANVQALLANARGHEHVNLVAAELLHDELLLALRLPAHRHRFWGGRRQPVRLDLGFRALLLVLFLRIA